MRTRLILAIAAALLILFDLGFVVYEANKYSATTKISPTHTVTGVASPSPQATATPTFSQQISTDEYSVFDPIVAILAFDAAIVIAVLVAYLLIRIWYLSGLTNLVIDTFNNATGKDGLDKVLPGLNQLTRETLAKVLEKVRTRMKKYNDDPNLNMRSKFPAPAKDSDQQLTNLLASLKGIASGEVSTAVQLLSFVFTPRGTKITATLQTKGDTPPIPGISLEVVDLQGDKEPILRTILEQSDAPEGGTGSQAVAASPPSASTLPPQQAQSYYDLGVQLDTLGLYEDAINYFEEALKRDKKSTEAAKALAASVSRLQVQQSGTSTYTVGKKLQDAGLSLQAIESYKKPLPIADQADAEEYWKAVLKLTNESEATAYLKLAELYRKDGVFLFDQSLELYKASVTRGSFDAAKELENIQRTGATQLTEAARILYGLTQYDAAEKYLQAALAKVPGDSGAQAMLATVKQNKPPEENKDALAFYTLGQLYEGRGALDEARSQYENALTKQPNYENANDALKRVLQTRKTLEDRYLELVEPAVAWLAIEIAQRSMEEDAPSIIDRVRRYFMLQTDERNVKYQAILHNFIGSFQQANALRFKTFPIFYDAAIEDFNQAITSDKDWFQPYENLADTYVMRAQAIMEPTRPSKGIKMVGPIRSRSQFHPDSVGSIPPSGTSLSFLVGKITPGGQEIDYLYKALTNYDAALKLLRNGKQRGYIQTIERRIQIGKFTAQLLRGIQIDDKHLIAGTVDEIKKTRRDIKSEKDSHLLYNLACWYGIADRQQIDVNDPEINVEDPKQAAIKAARCYVTYSLARDRDPEHDLWNWASHDPSLVSDADETRVVRSSSGHLHKRYMSFVIRHHRRI